MAAMAGKVATISRVLENGKYNVKEDVLSLNWTDGMFSEGVSTRGDIIRRMTDEQLASFLWGYCAICSHKNMSDYSGKSCFGGRIAWFKEPGDSDGLQNMKLREAEDACERLRIGGYRHGKI